MNSSSRSLPQLGRTHAVQIRLEIVNWHGEEAFLVVGAASLERGRWVEAVPEKPLVVRWGELLEYHAEGGLPEGVGGSTTLALAQSNRPAVLIHFLHAEKTAQASFDGHRATPHNPYCGTWEGQKATLVVHHTDALLLATLALGDQQPAVPECP